MDRSLVLPRVALATALFVAAPFSACTRFGAVYPPRPVVSVGEPGTEPLPSRVVAHLTVTSSGLKEALDSSVPRHGEGTFHMLGSERFYSWDLEGFSVKFSSSKLF